MTKSVSYFTSVIAKTGIRSMYTCMSGSQNMSVLELNDVTVC